MPSGPEHQFTHQVGTPTSFLWLTALYPQGPPAPLKIVGLPRDETLGDLALWRRQGGSIHVSLEAGAGFRRFWQLMRVTRHLVQEGFEVQLVGLDGAMERPRMLVPLRSEVLHYVHTVAFRGTDSPVRVWFKRMAGLLPPSWTWRGPLVLVASSDPTLFDRFVLLTEDREIAFLFRNQEKTPWAVRKCGAQEELIAEYRNHSRASQILGRCVPALLGMSESGKTAAISLEAIPERFLGNVVAEKPWRKQKVFVRETLAHVEFCLAVYRRFVQGAPPVAEPVTAGEVEDLLAGLEELPDAESERAEVKTALHGCVGAMLPRLIQHGDFCVRNVLIAGGERGRVLIDWEDLREARLPLADFTLLRLSLKEAFAGLFRCSLDGMEQVPELAQGLAAAERELADLLGLKGPRFRQAALLSLACLCGQNLSKKRYPTARAIFAELLRVCRA